MIKWLILASVVFFNPVTLASTADYKDLFKDAFPVLDDTVSLMDKHDSLPDSAFFSEDKEDNDQDINDLVDEALKMFHLSNLNVYRDEVHDLEAQIADEKANINEYRRKQIPAPEESMLGMDNIPLIRTTVTGYKRKIVDAQAKIEQYRQRITEVKQRFAKALEEIGIKVTDDQLEIWFGSISGDDLINMRVVYDNIKAMAVELQGLTQKSGEDLVAAKRYYGMFVVLYKVVVHMQATFIKKVEGDYIPHMEKYQAEALHNIKQANRGIELKLGDRGILESNIKTNKLTQKAARLYIKILKSQADKVHVARKKAKGELFVATNTYKTVSLSHSVVSMIKVGLKQFDALVNMQAPDMVKFENKALKEEFMKLTERYKSGSP